MTALPPPTGHPVAADSPAIHSSQGRRAHLLVASGVLSIVSASVLGGLGGLFLVWATILTAGVGGACETPTPWAPTWGTALLLHLTLFAAVFVSGVGSLQGRAWGRVVTLVAQTLVVGALAMSTLAVPWVGWVMPLGWSVATWSLAAIGTPMSHGAHRPAQDPSAWTASISPSPPSSTRITPPASDSTRAS